MAFHILLFLSLVFLTLYLYIEHDVRNNIQVARNLYPGKAEDALILYLTDTLNTPYDRTHIAIWTLGQIKSEKALPILNKLYINDPEGLTCSGKHESVLCQYEIHKAIEAISSKWYPLHAQLNK